MEAIVLLSGGQDSTTCLAWAQKALKADVRALSFDYGQRHSIELKQSARIADIFGVDHEVLPVEALSRLSSAALTNPDIDVEAEASAESGNVHARTHGLPSTFVPGRNMLFFTLAAAYGSQFGVYDLVTGVCEQDRSGYPDCRSEFVNAAIIALSTALDERVDIHAPLLFRSKADTWRLADTLGVLDIIVQETHTCYHGDRSVMHEWGAGCGECPACVERAKGWNTYTGGVPA